MSFLSCGKATRRPNRANPEGESQDILPGNLETREMGLYCCRSAGSDGKARQDWAGSEAVAKDSHLPLWFPESGAWV